MRRLIVAGQPVAAGARSLEGGDAHYVRDVLRLRVGDSFELGDGGGLLAVAKIRSMDRRQVELVVLAPTPAPEPAGPVITLVQAIGKGDKVDAVVRQTTELGVRRFVPVRTARTVARHDHRRTRWLAIAADAVRVSGRAHLPEIEPIAELVDVLRRAPPGRRLVLAPEGAVPLGPQLPANGEAATIIVGPEGGLTDEELGAAQAAGYVAVGLGPHTLRTQTAGPAVVAVCMFAAGALDPA